jgi:hypothetical protein
VKNEIGLKTAAPDCAKYFTMVLKQPQVKNKVFHGFPFDCQGTMLASDLVSENTKPS